MSRINGFIMTIDSDNEELHLNENEDESINQMDNATVSISSNFSFVQDSGINIFIKDNKLNQKTIENKENDDKKDVNQENIVENNKQIIKNDETNCTDISINLNTISETDITKDKITVCKGNNKKEELSDLVKKQNSSLNHVETSVESDSNEEKNKKEAFFEADPFSNNEINKIKTFNDLKLNRALMKAIELQGYTTPTPIQARVIPVALTGKDICASAQTGSGKTAAFLLPILERLQFRSRQTVATRVMIICPVRELATQCQSVLNQLGKFTDLTWSLVVGGLCLKQQEVELRNRPDIVVCTPGRMIDHLRNSKSVHMEDLEILVLDEADRLLELGFHDEILELIRMCPSARQTMLFSATMTTKVDQLIELSMKRPVRISVDPLYDVSNHLIQEFVRIRPNREDDREAILLALCTRTFNKNTIVFMETKRHAHRMMIIFKLTNIKAAELHGNLSQSERLEALQQFRDGHVDILLCTDIAARGIDIKHVDTVINYEMPKDISTYVHRVGRTARAGRNGRSVTLTSESRRLVSKQIARQCQGIVKSRSIPSEIIDQWKHRIESLQKDINGIMKDERLKKNMSEAEREITRASNLLKFKNEIESRPARTWFQSKEEKETQSKINNSIQDTNVEKENKNNRLQHGKDKTKEKGNNNVKLSRKKRKLVEIRQMEEKIDNDENEPKKIFTESSVASAARQFKKRMIKKDQEKHNLTISEISEAKASKRTAANNKKKNNIFDSDMSIKKNTPKKDFGNQMTKEYVFKEKITNLNGKIKKGSKTFKSKKRYSRRK